MKKNKVSFNIMNSHLLLFRLANQLDCVMWMDVPYFIKLDRMIFLYFPTKKVRADSLCSGQSSTRHLQCIIVTLISFKQLFHVVQDLD